MSEPSPPAWRLGGIAPTEALRTQGFCLLTPSETAGAAGCSLRDLAALTPYWEDLPPDAWLRDGGAYRFRRHASLIQDRGTRSLVTAPPRPHWQPTDYNALHGGLERWFEPIDPRLLALPSWQTLLTSLGDLFGERAGVDRWYIEAHQFRIDTAQGIGRPTPEGAHRDGVDYVAVILVRRGAVRGGETRVFAADGPHGIRFTMHEPWTALLLDDRRVIHETTPVQSDDRLGVRDTLVLTYRAHGFLSPA
jgi:hypothetical protein